MLFSKQTPIYNSSFEQPYFKNTNAGSLLTISNYFYYLPQGQWFPVSIFSPRVNFRIISHKMYQPTYVDRLYLTKSIVIWSYKKEHRCNQSSTPTWLPKGYNSGLLYWNHEACWWKYSMTLQKYLKNLLNEHNVLCNK